MDSSHLRHLGPRELALHFRRASKEQSPRTVLFNLLEAIEIEALPPTVFYTFLTSVKTPCLLKDALWQGHSKQVRYAAIQRFGKDLKGVEWKNAWQEVGGTEGLLDLFSQLSVLEVKQLSQVIGRCPGRSVVKDGNEREQRVTELIQCLMHPLYPSSTYKSKDHRPLYDYYAQMIPACTSDFIESLLRQNSHPLLESIPKKTLARNHFELLRQLLLEAIPLRNLWKPAAAQRVLDYIPLLLHHAQSALVVESRCSASMSLAVAILEKLSFEKDGRFPEENFMPLLMVPLMRRLKAHRVDKNRVQQVVQMAASYFQKRENARMQLSLFKGNMPWYIAGYWSHSAPQFEKCLTDFIGFLRHGAQGGYFDFQDLIDQVAKPQRYDLLRILCLHCANIKADIGIDQELNNIPIQRWPIFIFEMLQRDHSISLLQRLIRLKPEAIFLELLSGDTILSQSKSPLAKVGVPGILLALLQPRNEGLEQRIQRLVEALKSKAAKSREQTDRAFFAKSAAFHAIASGSLKLYGDVLQWTRRFVRDANTVKTVCSQDATCTKEGIALLGGVPDDLEPWTAAEIRTRLAKANTIMMNLLDTAVMSLREPSFYAPTWDGPLILFGQVVASRVSSADRLKKHFKLSEDEVYDTLWSETIEVLLQAEEIGLKHEALGFNSPHGPLGFSSNDLSPINPALPSFYKFLDNLAMSRDSLWKRFRPTMDPAVAALRPPWPRGLPIQCLIESVDVAVDSAITQMPFIADRAVKVVMADPAVVLGSVPIDKETRCAIGQFIDSFSVALMIYVMQSSSGYERDHRVYAAWSHAINVLSQKLSSDEAEMFWRGVFQRAIPQANIPDSKIKVKNDYPVIPITDDPQQPYEWNPAALIPPNVESRELPVSVLDCMAEATPLLKWSTRHDFRVSTPKTQAALSAPIWSYDRLNNSRKIQKSVQEGIIATALLIESSKIEGSKLMAFPFPSEIHVRYPSLFLDLDFLLSSNASLNPSADVALSYLIKMVPSTRLLELARSALDVLSRTPSDPTELASIERIAYRLLKLLCKSDRPHLASNLVVRTIFDHTDASSWHRQLLTKNLVRNLSAAQARETISLFTSSTFEVLEHQKTTPQISEKTKASPSSPNQYIKTTTVKFLAQFLDDADFVSPGFCVDTLSMLFQKASHVDIRVAVLDAMLSSFGHCADKPSDLLAEKLVSALEMTIPVLGSLNERRQTKDSDWADVEKTGRLPEVYDDGGMQAFPPMLNVIFRAITSSSIPSDILRRAILPRIVLPIIEKSIVESARWVKMFTFKHLPAGRSIQLPHLPVRPGILVYFTKKCPGEVPEYILNLYQQFFLTNVLPPVDVIELNNKINDDIELRDSNEGQFWLSLYGRGADVPTHAITTLLTKPYKFSLSEVGGISISRIQQVILEQADALLRLADESSHHWSKFIAVLSPPLAEYHSGQTRKAWSANAKPVVKRIIERINTLRTPAWQRDPNRQPAVLPPTFGLRLWLLDYPQLCPLSSPGACDTFAQQIITALREILGLGLAHHALLDEVTTALSKCLPDDSRRVACHLGSLVSDDDDEDETKAQMKLLRVELADQQLRRVKLPQGRDDEIMGTVKSMLESWKKSELEEVRIRGMRLGKELKI